MFLGNGKFLPQVHKEPITTAGKTITVTENPLYNGYTYMNSMYFPPSVILGNRPFFSQQANKFSV